MKNGKEVEGYLEGLLAHLNGSEVFVQLFAELPQLPFQQFLRDRRNCNSVAVQAGRKRPPSAPPLFPGVAQRQEEAETCPGHRGAADRVRGGVPSGRCLCRDTLGLKRAVSPPTLREVYSGVVQPKNKLCKMCC